MRRAAAILVLLAGCSSTDQIAQSSTRIGALAQSSKDRFQYISGEARSDAPDLPGIADSAEGGIVEQDGIIYEVTQVVHSLPGVRDLTPWWATLITYALILGSLVSVLAILWRLGIDRLVRSWLGLASPGAQAEARMAADIVQSDPGPRVLRRIETRRAQDHDFDRAFRRAAPMLPSRKKVTKNARRSPRAR